MSTNGVLIFQPNFRKVQFCCGMGGKTSSKNTTYLPHSWRLFPGGPQPVWLPEQIGHFFYKHVHTSTSPWPLIKLQNLTHQCVSWAMKSTQSSQRFAFPVINLKIAKIDPGILESEQNNFGHATITDRTPQFHMRCHNSWEGISPSYYRFNLGGVKTISPHQGHPGGEERFAYLASLSAFLQRYNSLPWGNVPGTNIKALGHRCRRRQRFWCVPRQPLVLRGMARMVETPKHCAFGASAHCTCCWDVGCEFQNAAVTCHTDNEALVAIINKQSSKLRVVMTMIRRLVQASLKYNFLFKAIFVPGLRNQKADALSRFQVQLFRRLHPTANRQPSAFPSLPESLS